MHKSLTTQRLLDAIRRRDEQLDNPGFCTRCGEEQDGCEPDAAGYECDECGTATVYGAEMLLLG